MKISIRISEETNVIRYSIHAILYNKLSPIQDLSSYYWRKKNGLISIGQTWEIVLQKVLGDP